MTTRKNWKRFLLSVVPAVVVMGADTLALAQLTRWYRPGHPPAWAVNCLYYFLAWPLALTRLVFPREFGDADEGPSLMAVASAGIIDLLVLTLLIYALRSRASKRRERRAGV